LVFLFDLLILLEGDREATENFFAGVPGACVEDGFGLLEGVGTCVDDGFGRLYGVEACVDDGFGLLDGVASALA